jgi:hypothetical protein
MNKIFLILLLFTTIAKAISLPIPEQTLKALLENSPYVIIGNVSKIENIKHPINSDSLTRAKINVFKIFKGNITSQFIYIYFQPNLICPAPDNYELNTKVLCFIDNNFDKEVGGFFAPSLSYASKKILDRAEEEFYEKRINEFSKIKEISDQIKQDYEMTEWLVKCAENQLTRFDGTHELLKKFDYEKNIKTVDYQKLLSKNQKERLYSCFLNLPQPETQDFNLLPLITDVDNEKLLSHLKKLAHTVKSPNWLDGNLYIYWIGTYSNNDYSNISNQLTANLGSMRYDTPEDRKRMELVYTNFLKLIDEDKKS